MKTFMEEPETEIKPVFYSESQGNERDKEIFERYQTIVNYFVQNPDRVVGINFTNLAALGYHDHILVKRDKGMNLKITLLTVLSKASMWGVV